MTNSSNPGKAKLKKRVAIVYSSHCGHTDKIAEFMAGSLESLGHEVESFNVLQRTAPSEDDLRRFDAIIVGGAVYFGEYEEHLLDWAGSHSERLNEMSCGLFSITLYAASSNQKSHEKCSGYVRKFSSLTGMQPVLVSKIAGAINYSKLGRLNRMLLKWSCSKAGLESDGVTDQVFTDWAQVAAFASAVADASRPALRAFKSTKHPTGVPYAA